MQRRETPQYINERPRPGQKHNRKTNGRERRTIKLVACSFGALCFIQAILNVSLILVYKNHLENRNTELINMLQKGEEEKERLKMQLKELTFCPPSQQCPAGWTEINSRCYFLSRQSNTWEESRRFCQSKGADLVVINSEQEQTSLYRMNGEKVLLFWIGLRNINGTFTWVDGSALNKSFWEPGKPKLNDNEDCVESYHLRSELNNWNDAPCEKRQRWLCERDPCTRS